MYRIEHLNKAFGEKQVLRDFSCDLPRGSFTVLTGPSGVGKTTLLRILMGLTPADGGTYPRLTVSAVFQENRLLPGRTPVENLSPICRDKARIRTLLGEILPPEALDKPVEQLSGGMQRRVAIARALAAESELILMDEPFTGLDPDTAHGVVLFILDRKGDRTLLVATHQPELTEAFGPRHIAME